MERSALSVLEAIVDSTGVADHLEELLPIGVRERQLKVRTLLVGISPSERDDPHTSRECTQHWWSFLNMIADGSGS